MGGRLLCLHETATSGAVWQPLSAALPDAIEVLAPDRLGWGEEEPEGYRATTIDEQAEEAARQLVGGKTPALVAGAGTGAAIALHLLLGRPELVEGALLIEPPLLAFVPAATEALSADRAALGDAVSQSGIEAGVELYLRGGMSGLAPGAERLPGAVTENARIHPRSLFTELGTVPGWNLPFRDLRTAENPSRIVVSAGTPAFLREAAEQVSARLTGSELAELPGAGPAHLDAPEDLAKLVAALSAE